MFSPPSFLPGPADKPKPAPPPSSSSTQSEQVSSLKKAPKITHLLSEQAVRQNQQQNLNLASAVSPSSFPAHLALINPGYLSRILNDIAGTITEIRQDSFSTSAGPLHCPSITELNTSRVNPLCAHMALNRTNELMLKSFFIRQFYLL